MDKQDEEKTKNGEQEDGKKEGEQEDDSESEYTWYFHPLFKENGDPNTGRFSVQTFEMPLQDKVPFDVSKLVKHKDNIKLKFELNMKLLNA